MVLNIRQNLRVFATASILALASPAFAHCDAMDGPVILEAQAALEAGNIAPLLKWVPATDEAALAAAFDKTRAVRALGGDARELADRHFFARLVEIHRAAEGAPFTGLKPAGEIDPAVRLADEALEGGSIDAFLARIVEKFEHNARAAFASTLAARRTADESVERGREFVENYVRYVHYVENVHNVISGEGGPHDH